jgi:hypothetical protein
MVYYQINMAEDGEQVIVQKPPKKGLNLWKYIAIILIFALIGVGAYEWGKTQTPSTNIFNMPKPTITQVNTSPTVVQPALTIIPNPTSSLKKVSAGMKNQLFSPYAVMVPPGWVDNNTVNTVSDTLTLTKGQYVLTISQAAGGAGSCNYPGDTPEPMAQVFTNFVGITGTFSQFRRGTTDNKTYTVCEQKSGGFSFPTSVGYITYNVPTQADQSSLGEMDQMVASLTK